MGDKQAATTLKQVATHLNPKAFYALGLEYLRRHQGTDAVLSFQQGIRGAPEVAELLLGTTLPQFAGVRRNTMAAHQYVETFCLSEWTASELAALAKVVVKTGDSKW